MEKPEEPTTLNLATAAAKAAAEQVVSSPGAKRRQRKVIVISCCVSLVAVLLVALPTAYFLDRDRVRSNVARARYNCDQQAASVKVQRHILQVGTNLRQRNRALGEDPRVRKAVLEVFGAELVARLYAKQAAFEKDAVQEWNADLAKLGDLADVDCDEVIVASGVVTTPTTTATTSTTTTPAR